MKNKRKVSSEVNKEILKKQLKLIQYKNTTIFENDSLFVLSPSVQNEQKWFDIREVNLIKVDTNKEALLIIRYFYCFIKIKLNDFIKKMIQGCKLDCTKNSGNHWKFIIKNEYILNKKSKSNFKINIIEDINLL